MSRLLIVATTALVLGASPCAARGANADKGEEIFKSALRYTVQIRTMVPMPFDGDRKGSSFGAGFLIDAARGWIMTNAHVVSRSPSRVEVAFHGQEYSEASKVYVDPYLDLAIIKAHPQQDTGAVRAPPLECGDLPPVGHPVGAFGHPWRLEYTGTRGIVSGVTARYRTELLQTDAPINAGNSGGPLISLDSGRIVGINTASIAGAQNTNFAVAMKYACRIVQLLQAGADPSPPDLGWVYFQDTDNRKVLRIARDYANPGAAGTLPGDIVQGVVGVESRIENETQLLHALRGRLDASRIKVLRDGRELEINSARQPMPRVLDKRGVYVSGVLFGPITLRDADEVRMRGLMVHHVEPGSPGESQDIRRRDVLEAIDGERVEDLDLLLKKLSDIQARGSRTSLAFRRLGGGDAMFTYAQRNLAVRELRVVGFGD